MTNEELSTIRAIRRSINEIVADIAEGDTDEDLVVQTKQLELMCARFLRLREAVRNG